jgi:hypothetical protein
LRRKVSTPHQVRGSHSLESAMAAETALRSPDLLLSRPAFSGEIDGLQIRLHDCDFGDIARRSACDSTGWR